MVADVMTRESTGVRQLESANALKVIFIADEVDDGTVWSQIGPLPTPWRVYAQSVLLVVISIPLIFGLGYGMQVAYNEISARWLARNKFREIMRARRSASTCLSCKP
jgi:hypothetical protein